MSRHFFGREVPPHVVRAYAWWGTIIINHNVDMIYRVKLSYYKSHNRRDHDDSRTDRQTDKSHKICAMSWLGLGPWAMHMAAVMCGNRALDLEKGATSKRGKSRLHELATQNSEWEHAETVIQVLGAWYISRFPQYIKVAKQLCPPSSHRRHRTLKVLMILVGSFLVMTDSGQH